MASEYLMSSLPVWSDLCIQFYSSFHSADVANYSANLSMKYRSCDTKSLHYRHMARSTKCLCTVCFPSYIPAVVDHRGGMPCHGTFLLHQVCQSHCAQETIQLCNCVYFSESLSFLNSTGPPEKSRCNHCTWDRRWHWMEWRPWACCG